MTLLALILINALLYRFRGGGLFLLPRETEGDKQTQARRIIFALGTGASTLLLGLAWWEALVVAAVMFVWQLTGNGAVIGSVGNWQTKPMEEFGPLDKLATFITKKLRGDPQDHKVTWGIAWYALWGLSMALCLSLLPSLHLLGLLPLMLIGAAYRVALEPHGPEGWGLGELYAGGVIGLALYLGSL